VMWAVFVITLAVIIGAWIFEYAGYPPCELCLKQRWAYYTIVPLSAVFAVAASNNPNVLRYGLYLVGLIMLASCIFGIYHAGVEWKFWQGPTSCTGGGPLPARCLISANQKPCATNQQSAFSGYHWQAIMR